jgi:hypothetical protein
VQFDFVSTCAAFLLGTLTGAAGMYYGELFTDQRRKKEKARAERQAFDTVCQQMPDLIKEMRDDLTQKPHVREFFLLHEGSAFGIKNSDAFVYRASEKHPVRSWAKTLENHGYVQDVTPGNTPKYRMTEEFVGLILKPK